MSTPSEPRVRLYTTMMCAYCRAAKGLLEKRGVAYSEVDLSQDPVARQTLVARTGWRTVPLIEIDGELVGGFTELRRLDLDGELEALVAPDRA